MLVKKCFGGLNLIINLLRNRGFLCLSHQGRQRTARRITITRKNKNGRQFLPCQRHEKGSLTEKTETLAMDQDQHSRGSEAKTARAG
jgi:hypothetical protein